MEEKVQKILDKMRPFVQMHGGDVSLVDITDNVVKIRVTGACVNCSLADLTYRDMFGGILKEEVPEVKDIIIES